jgi:phage FluMu protein Com
MLTDVQPIYAIHISEAPIPRPRVRFRDYRCNHCGRLLMRASLDNIAMSLPADFAKSHPLAWVALKSIMVEIRCVKCSVICTFAPSFQQKGES